MELNSSVKKSNILWQIGRAEYKHPDWDILDIKRQSWHVVSLNVDASFDSLNICFIYNHKYCIKPISPWGKEREIKCNDGYKRGKRKSRIKSIK